MSKIRSADHLTDEELIVKMEISETIQQFRRWQAVWLIQTRQLSSAEIAGIVRAGSGTVLHRVHLYNRKGEEGLKFAGSGGRRRCHMSHDKEISFPEESEKDAGKGLIITAETVRQRAAEKSGHEVSEDYAYDLPHRHRRKKKSPRPVHPEADKSGQEEYEKNFRIWLKKRQKRSCLTINGRSKYSSEMREYPVG